MAVSVKKISLILFIALLTATGVGKRVAYPNSDISINLQLCSKSPNPTDCAAKYFSQRTKQVGLEKSFEELSKLQLTQPVFNDCHFVAHAIAAAEIKNHPANFKEVLNSRCPQSCSYGCSHGALEAYAELTKSLLTENLAINACDQTSPPSCPHGIGHILLVISENDLAAALASCHKIPLGTEPIYQCLTGVFMELVSPQNLISHGLLEPTFPEALQRIDQLQATCQALAGVDAWACWKEVSPIFVKKNGYDPKILVTFCNSLPNLESSWECQYRSIDILAWHRQYQIENLDNICEVATDKGFHQRCIEELIISILENSPQELEKVASFCLSLKTDSEGCYRAIGFSRSLNPRLLTQACLQVPDQQRKLCQGSVDLKLRPYLN